VIAVRGLAHRYGTAEALRLPEWKVAQGERWLVLGPSGCGKTTLLHILAGLVRPSEGEVEVSGERLLKLEGARLDRWRATTVGIVLQALHLVKHLSVSENLRLAQYLAQMPQDDARIADTLGALGIAGKSARRPSELSQGERQRVAIARAVVNRPKLVLADEPTGNLDPATGEEVQRLLIELNRERGVALVIVTHNPRLAAEMDRVLRLHDGHLEEEKTHARS
jgi:putative ABC transport system ATP-binding protein